MNTKASRLRREKRIRQPPFDENAYDFVLSDVTPTHHSPNELPDPWLYDSECLLRDLDRLRELILLIPLHQDTFSPTNVAIAAAWDLRQKLQYLIALRAGMQRSWQRKAAATANPTEPDQIGTLSPSGAKRRYHASGSSSHRRAS